MRDSDSNQNQACILQLARNSSDTMVEWGLQYNPSEVQYFMECV